MGLWFFFPPPSNGPIPPPPHPPHPSQKRIMSDFIGFSREKENQILNFYDMKEAVSPYVNGSLEALKDDYNCNFKQGISHGPSIQRIYLEGL